MTTRLRAARYGRSCTQSLTELRVNNCSQGSALEGNQCRQACLSQRNQVPSNQQEPQQNQQTGKSRLAPFRPCSWHKFGTVPPRTVSRLSASFVTSRKLDF